MVATFCQCARRGHLRTVPYAKMSSKGRTELQISLSKAKHVEETAGDARFCRFRQNQAKVRRRQILHQNFPKVSEPNTSKGIHPNASECVAECIRTGPIKSENFEKVAKTSKIFANFRKPRKTLRIFRENFREGLFHCFFQ